MYNIIFLVMMHVCLFKLLDVILTNGNQHEEFNKEIVTYNLAPLVKAYALNVATIVITLCSC